MANENTAADTEDQTDDLPEDPQVDTPADETTPEEDLRLLSDEERAALEDADTLDEEDTGEGEAPDAGEEPAPVADPAPQAPAEAAPAVDPEAVQAALAEAEQAKEAAFDKYEDGELTRAEYLAELKRIDTEYAGAAAAAALEARQMQERVAGFKQEAIAYLTAVPALKDPAHLEAFDAHVRAVTGDPRSANLTFRQMLEMAHARYAAEAAYLGVTVPPVPSGKPAAQKTAQKAEPPVTLARVPAAAVTSASDGKWGQLQKAVDEGDAATVERIMAGLTEAEREAFASMDV